MNIILVLILVYLIFKYKSSKNEPLSIYPSDISVLIYDQIPDKIRNAEILLLPSKTNNDNYIRHNSNIYVKKAYNSFYNKNYGYESKQLYYNDFRWKYIDVYVTKDISDHSIRWVKQNSLASPGFYKILYIHNDKINRYNRSIKDYIKMDVNLIICNINPYKCYKINNSYIVTNRKLNGTLIKQIDTTNAYLKIYLDHYKLVGVLYQNQEVLHTFEIESKVKAMVKNVNLLEGPGKTQPPEHKIIGMPKINDIFTKWKDPFFDRWFKYFLKRLQQELDPKVDVNKLELPTNYINYLYMMNSNFKHQVDIRHVVEQVITDFGLPINSNNI